MRPSTRATPTRAALVRSAVVAGLILFGVTGCVPTTATPTPTTASSASPTPTPTSPSQSPDPEEIEVTAALVVVTATTTSVFGTDGSTLASVNYEMDGATAVAELAAALDAEPAATPIPEIGGGPCPAATGYDFGGLLLRSPGSLGSSGSFEVVVTTATTAGGVGIETIAAQQIGATRAAFEAAVGEFMPLYDPPHPSLGFDIVNPEAGEYERIGAYAEFSGGTLVYLATPHLLGFVGSCA